MSFSINHADKDKYTLGNTQYSHNGTLGVLDINVSLAGTEFVAMLPVFTYIRGTK